MTLRTSICDTLPHEDEQLPTSELRKMEEHLAKQFATSSNLTVAIIVKHARLILKEQPELREFCMGMGTWMFETWDGKLVDGYDLKQFPDLRTFDDFMCRWDDTFKITGEPVRFTADGPLVTDW